MIFQRAKGVPSTPKIGKIALPGGDSRSSTPMNMPPPRSMTPMTTTGGPAAAGRPALLRRGLSGQAEAPSMTGYVSEPGGGSSPTNSRRNLRVVLVPTKTEDGPSRTQAQRVEDPGSAVPPIRRSSRITITLTGPQLGPGSVAAARAAHMASMAGPDLGPDTRTTSRITPPNVVAMTGSELGPDTRTASSRVTPPMTGPELGPDAREPHAPVIMTPRPRRPSVVADITPRPRKPSVLDERPPPLVQSNGLRVPPLADEKIHSILKKGVTPRKRTTSLSQLSTIPDIHWRLLPYDTLRSKQCQHFNIALPPDAMVTSCRPKCRTITPKDMSKPAAAEKLTNMIIMCNDLPWKVVVDRPEGITCFDVFQAIHDTFDIPLSEKERTRFPNKVQQCKKAFELRCKTVPRLTAVEEKLGMKRVDLLNCKTYFHGLIKPGVDEPWLMILGPTPPCSGIVLK